VEYLRELLFIQLKSKSQAGTIGEIQGKIEHAQIEYAQAEHAQNEQTQAMELHARSFSLTELLHIIRIFNHAAVEARGMWQPFLPLEMAFVESLEYLTESEGSSQESQSNLPANVHYQGSPVQPSPSKIAESANYSEDAAEQNPLEQKATQTLTETWGKILALVRQQNPRAYGLLNSCKSRLLRGDLLILSFSSDVLKGQMEKPDNLEVACQALRQILQRDITIQCNVDATRRGVGGSQNSVPSGVDENGMVAAALRDLGGEIVDIN